MAHAKSKIEAKYFQVGHPIQLKCILIPVIINNQPSLIMKNIPRTQQVSYSNTSYGWWESKLPRFKLLDLSQFFTKFINPLHSFPENFFSRFWHNSRWLLNTALAHKVSFFIPIYTLFFSFTAWLTIKTSRTCNLCWNNIWCTVFQLQWLRAIKMSNRGFAEANKWTVNILAKQNPHQNTFLQQNLMFLN